MRWGLEYFTPIRIHRGGSLELLILYANVTVRRILRKRSKGTDNPYTRFDTLNTPLPHIRILFPG